MQTRIDEMTEAIKRHLPDGVTLGDPHQHSLHVVWQVDDRRPVGFCACWASRGIITFDKKFFEDEATIGDEDRHAKEETTRCIISLDMLLVSMAEKLKEVARRSGRVNVPNLSDEYASYAKEAA